MERGMRSWRAFARVSAVLAVVLSAVTALGCSSDPEEGDPSGMTSASCVPGIALMCMCADGVTQGVQLCDATGRMLGACDCGPGTAAGAGGGATGGSGGTGVPVAGLGGTGSVNPTGGAAGISGMTGGSAGSAGTLAGTTGGAGTGAGTMAPPAGALAADVRIKEVAIYQAVKVALSASGESVIERNAPVIIGKEALVRVFVEPLAGFASRMIEVELTLESSEGPAASQTATKMVSSASIDGELDSTINFDIPGEHITGDLKYSVALRDASQGGTGTVDPAARFPTTEGELIELGARDAGPLRVMLVPYRYQGDGSGRSPTMDAEQLALFERYLQSYYPASQIEITVHEPVDYADPVGPNTGWEQWLDFHCNLRTQEDPDPKLLYYGVMSPRDSINAYGGGIAGISPVPSPSSNYRCSVGLGFQGNVAASTMAHELGHSLGLPHAPCGVDGGPFPYAEASIGSWGYSLGAQELRDPSQYKDMMSYCDPSFISDYNFEKLFERIRYLNLQFDVLQSEPTRYARVLLDKNGQLSMRGYVTTKRLPGGDDEARMVTMLDAKGRALADATKAYWMPFSEASTGVWLVPSPEKSAARAVRLDGKTVVLP